MDNQQMIIVDETLIGNDNEIELSVVVPFYRSKRINWITFEGLKNQKNIDFNWELIISQEKLEPYITYDEIKEKYLDDLVKI